MIKTQPLGAAVLAVKSFSFLLLVPINYVYLNDHGIWMKLKDSYIVWKRCIKLCYILSTTNYGAITVYTMYTLGH